MAYYKTMQVKTTGNSKVVWMDRSWGIQKGDMLEMSMVLDGHTYITTTHARENGSRFIPIPKFWPVEVGDIVDVKIAYANVPRRVTVPKNEDSAEPVAESD